MNFIFTIGNLSGDKSYSEICKELLIIPKIQVPQLENFNLHHFYCYNPNCFYCHSQENEYKKNERIFNIYKDFSNKIQKNSGENFDIVPINNTKNNKNLNAKFLGNKRSFKKKLSWKLKEERLLFQEYISKNNTDIESLKQIFKNKSEEEIESGIKKISIYKNKHFSKYDDIKIINLVNEYGKNWDLIAENFGRFSKELIINRYNNNLDPLIDNSRFTEEEDSQIFNLKTKYRMGWKEISTYFVNRNSNKIRNRYYSVLRRKFK